MNQPTLITALIGTLIIAAANASPPPEHRFTNDDGSSTWVDPVLRFEGKDFPFAVDSIHDIRTAGTGICRLAGHERFVYAETRDLPRATAAVLVDVSGAYQAELRATRIFSRVTCATGPVGLSRRYESSLANEDGSFTVVHPMFKYAGELWPIGIDTSQDSRVEGTGVCRLYGYERYITDTRTEDPFQEDRYPVVGHDGALTGLEYSTVYFNSITCAL
jgi:hypothetical protein